MAGRGDGGGGGGGGGGLTLHMEMWHDPDVHVNASGDGNVSGGGGGGPGGWGGLPPGRDLEAQRLGSLPWGEMVPALLICLLTLATNGVLLTAVLSSKQHMRTLYFRLVVNAALANVIRGSVVIPLSVFEVSFKAGVDGGTLAFLYLLSRVLPLALGLILVELNVEQCCCSYGVVGTDVMTLRERLKLDSGLSSAVLLLLPWLLSWTFHGALFATSTFLLETCAAVGLALLLVLFPLLALAIANGIRSFPAARALHVRGAASPRRLGWAVCLASVAFVFTHAPDVLWEISTGSFRLRDDPGEVAGAPGEGGGGWLARYWPCPGFWVLQFGLPWSAGPLVALAWLMTPSVRAATRAVLMALLTRRDVPGETEPPVELPEIPPSTQPLTGPNGAVACQP